MHVDKHKIFGHIDMMQAIGKSIAVLLAYLVGMYVTGRFHNSSNYLGAILACTSAIVVFQGQGVRDSFYKGWLRVLGTFIGAVVAYIYLEIFDFSIWGLTATVFVLAILCMLFRIPDNGRMATITLAIIMIVSKESPKMQPRLNGTLRFVESAVGVAIGVATIWAYEHIHKLLVKVFAPRPKPEKSV